MGMIVYRMESRPISLTRSRSSMSWHKSICRKNRRIIQRLFRKSGCSITLMGIVHRGGFMKLTDVVGHFLLDLEIKGRSKTTLVDYRHRLGILVQVLRD